MMLNCGDGLVCSECEVAAVLESEALFDGIGGRLAFAAYGCGGRWSERKHWRARTFFIASLDIFFSVLQNRGINSQENTAQIPAPVSAPFLFNIKSPIKCLP
jgi:hypothetical protein